MKAIKSIVLSALIVLACASCKKKEEAVPSDTDYLVFGHFYGMCQGEQCVEIFKLETRNLWEDDNDHYPGQQDFYQGHFLLLPSAKFEAVKDLADDFPAALLNETERVIGLPDAGDWGGLYIEYSQNGTHRFWLLDQKKDNVPAYLHHFIDRVNEKIALINL